MARSKLHSSPDWPLTTERDMHLFTGETRVSSEAGDLSVEPDMVGGLRRRLRGATGATRPAVGGMPDRSWNWRDP